MLFLKAYLAYILPMCKDGMTFAKTNLLFKNFAMSCFTYHIEISVYIVCYGFELMDVEAGCLRCKYSLVPIHTPFNNEL